MCGIAGQLGARLGGEVSQDVLARLAHRGPDGQGVYSSEPDGLLLMHTRLAILDPTSAGNQPMIDDTGEHAIVFNGEIYNFRELRAELSARGYTFRTGTDTEVLLALYRDRGDKMLQYLNGIFAFALWDTVRRQLLVARDGLGVKPLYISEQGGAFVFASELKALICFPSVKREIDVQAMAHFARLMWCPGPRSPLVGVSKVDPGEALWIRDGRIERRWHFYELPNLPVERDSIDAMAAKVRSALATAVQRQMVSDVPVGAFLSGGLDSSAIVAFARNHTAGRLQCFTIDFDEGFAAEEGFVRDLPFAQAVARKLDVDLHVVRVGPEMSEHFSDMVWHLDEPQADPAALNTLFISQLARQHGIKVLLSGMGGDEVFAGYRRHLAIGMDSIWSALRPIARLGLAEVARRFSNHSPKLRQLSKILDIARYQERDQRTAAYFEWLQYDRVRALFDARYAATLTESPLMDALSRISPDQTPLRRMMMLDQRYFLADHNLNYGDKMSMAAGVEMRVPFLDPDLMNLAATMPENFLVSGFETKYVLKRAMRGILPNEIIYRPKSGFGAPIRAWLRGPLRQLLNDVLSPTSLSRRGLFDQAGVARLMADEDAKRGDNAYTLFSLLCIELWCQRFIDGP